MNLDQTNKLVLEMTEQGFDAQKVRVAFDYSQELVAFLTKRNYNFCITHDAFGMQIVVSDANHLKNVEIPQPEV